MPLLYGAVLKHSVRTGLTTLSKSGFEKVGAFVGAEPEGVVRESGRLHCLFPPPPARPVLRVLRPDLAASSLAGPGRGRETLAFGISSAGTLYFRQLAAEDIDRVSGSLDVLLCEGVERNSGVIAPVALMQADLKCGSSARRRHEAR